MLESDEGIDDPKEYALSTGQPSPNLLSDVLRDELVEKGWRHIRLRQEDDEWVVEAGVIDPYHRTYWLEHGARVAPPPTDTHCVRMQLMRMFKAGALRASVHVEDARFEDLSPAYYDGYDLYTKYDDFEDDGGDWNIAIRFKWKPGDKFWSKSSQSLGYETKPYYQRQPPAPRPPIKPVAGATGKEPERIARRLKKGAAAAPGR